jgi:hypothetical protein
LLLHKYANDRLESMAVDYSPDECSGDDAKPDADPDFAADIAAPPRGVCLQEDFEHDCRRLTRPRWALGRDDTSALWYWQVLDGSQGYPTELWHFVHRNGEEAYGREPLEFWPDWKGHAAGDMAFATPFGLSMKELSELDMTGFALPTSEQIGNKYGEPVMHKKENDPMVMVPNISLDLC